MFRLGVAIWLALSPNGLAADAGLEDPTRPGDPPTASNVAPPPLPQLQSVLISDQRRVAVIAGVAVREGEEKNGLRLLAVRRNEVDVLIAGRGKFVLPLGTERIRKEVR